MVSAGRTQLSGGVLALVGSALAAFLVVDAARTADAAYGLVQTYPVALSLLLAGVGVLLARGRLIDERFLGRLLAWLVAGVAALSLLVAYLYGLMVFVAGHAPLDTPVGVITATTFGALVGLLVGVYDARALERKDAVTQLSRVTDTLRVATGELIAQPDRDALERTVCDRLAASDAYEAAWLGRHERGDGRLRTVAWAGLGDAALDAHSVPVEASATASPGVRAVESRTTQVVADGDDDPVIAAVREATPDRRVGAMAVVPVVWRTEVYGVLGLVAADGNSFDTRERAVVTELGEAVGHAIDAIRARDDLQRRERELVANNERLEEFASVVSHDLRNPLGVILGRVEYLRTNGDDEHLAVIERAGRRMDDIINDLLTLSRAGRSIADRAPVDLAAAAREAWENVDTGAAALELAVPGATTVDADRARLLTVFENLFRNAVEHGQTTTRPTDALTVRVGLLAPTAGAASDPVAGFVVEDDGAGIPADERDAVFDHGYTTNTDGTGFGLGIVEEVVAAHGWEITVTAAESGGARFEVLFG